MICEMQECALTSSAFKISSECQGSQRGYYKEHVFQCILRVVASSPFPILVPGGLLLISGSSILASRQEGAIV
jgi:hypothetical protein